MRLHVLLFMVSFVVSNPLHILEHDLANLCKCFRGAPYSNPIALDAKP